MDQLVLQAMAKWPNVPACTGWLGLDARGQWWMRDDAAQALGAFSSGIAGAKGSKLQHDKLIAFIGRNYAQESAGAYAGCWYFQNGPQKVYVELEATPWVWRIQDDFSVLAHTDAPAKPQRCILDEHGCVYLETDLGFGLVHSQDMLRVSQAIEQGLWVPLEIMRQQLPAKFSYVRSAQALDKAHSIIQKDTAS